MFLLGWDGMGWACLISVRWTEKRREEEKGKEKEQKENGRDEDGDGGEGCLPL